MKLGWVKLAGIAGLLCFIESARSAVLPGAAMPEQVGRALKQEQPQPEEVLPAIETPPAKETPLNKQAAVIKFKLNGIILVGNKIYSKAELSKLYRNKLHHSISVAELFKIVQDITNFYRNNGYILSRAILPPQHVKNGVVRIQIIEGYISEVDVTGQPFRTTCLVEAYGNKIIECRPLYLSRMEKYLFLANEIPGTKVKAVLSPSKSEKGASALSLVTENKPVTGYLSYDNYGTRYIGPQQMTANLAYNSIAMAGDSIQGTFTKTPKGGELTFADANYDFILNAEGTHWLFGGTRVQTHPLFVLEESNIDGLSRNYYTTLFFPVTRTRTKSFTLRAGFNYLDTHVTTFDTELYTDQIRSLDFGGTFNFSDNWYGANIVSLDIRQGLPIFGYSSDTELTALTSRPGGHADYTKFAITASRLQAIKWGLSLYGLVQGQYAFSPLLAPEQFAFGGPILGRGYDVAELLGDKGAAGSLELRYDLNPDAPLISMLEFYLFYDAGIIWNYIGTTNVPTQQDGTPLKASGTSTGVGLRFFTTKYLSGNLMWTQTLTKPVAAEELINEGRRPRVFFSVIATF